MSGSVKMIKQYYLFKNRWKWLSVHCRNSTVRVSVSPTQTILTKRIKGSLFLLILMWWAFISLCNSRCPWSRSQGGLPSNNRIAPSELKEHSDSPPDYDTVLGNCLKPIQPTTKTVPKTNPVGTKAMETLFGSKLWIPRPILIEIGLVSDELGLGLGFKRFESYATNIWRSNDATSNSNSTNYRNLIN